MTFVAVRLCFLHVYFSDFRYGSSDVYFPGYTSGTVYECIGAYDDAFFVITIEELSATKKVAEKAKEEAERAMDIAQKENRG